MSWATPDNDHSNLSESNRPQRNTGDLRHIQKLQIVKKSVAINASPYIQNVQTKGIEH